MKHSGTKVFSIAMPEDEYRRIREAAAQDGKSLKGYVLDLVEQDLKGEMKNEEEKSVH